MRDIIVEKQLGISPDYQYKKLRGKNFIFANWHNNKLVVMGYILKLTKAKEVLDLGTGSGNFELEFAKGLNKIVGVDYNDEAIRFLKSKLKENAITNVELKVCDIRKISKIKNVGKFDLIILMDIIEHLEIAEVNKLVRNIKRFLKKEGFVCVISPNYKSPWILIETMVDEFTRLPRLRGKQHLTRFYKENLKKMFTQKGYRPLFFSTFNLFSFLFFNKSIASKLCKLEMALKLPFGNLIVCLFKLSKTKE